MAYHVAGLVEIDGQRPLIGVDRFGEASDLAQHQAEVVPDGGQARSQVESPTVGGDRFFGLIRFAQNVAEADVRCPIAGIGGDGPAISCLGRRDIAVHQRQVAELDLDGTELRVAAGGAAKHVECRSSIAARQGIARLEKHGPGSRRRPPDGHDAVVTKRRSPARERSTETPRRRLATPGTPGCPPGAGHIPSRHGRTPCRPAVR